MDKILVLNGPSYANSLYGLGKIELSTKSFLKDPKSFKVVLFTGGADVSPKLYGDNSPSYCWTSPKRDEEEQSVFEIALKHNILMAGICRGVQFLNVMDGGKMMHHITHHEGAGPHWMRSPALKEDILVNTLHHQMILPSDRAEVIGVCRDRLSTIYIGNNDDVVDYKGPEIEAAIFPAIRALGVQYHPEMMPVSSEGYTFFYDMVKYALENPIEEVVRKYKGEQSLEYAKVCSSDVHTA